MANLRATALRPSWAYLGIIHDCEHWQAQGRQGAAGEMVAFVRSLATQARIRDSAFLIFPQNAPAILGELEPPEAEAYLAAVDGIGAEDSFSFGEADEDNPYDPQWETLASLDRFVRADKLVLAVDYLTDP